MPYEPTAPDYEPVTPLRAARTPSEDEAWDARSLHDRPADGRGDEAASLVDEDAASESSDAAGSERRASRVARTRQAWEWPPLRRGHALSFAGLLLFTAVVYFRPQELVPALASLSSLAFWVAVLTLVVFVPTQLGMEGTLTARPREVTLVLALVLLGLVGVPLAVEPAEAWGAWVDYAKVITMFVVMVNVVRTELRLRAMFWLALAVSLILSVNAISDYRAGRFAEGADRITGIIGGLFDNPNDLALHLVTMIPLAAALLFVSRGAVRKALYGAAALLMMLAVVVTYSRGGLLALACASFVMAWKLKRRGRAFVLAAFLAGAALLFVLAPSDFRARLGSMFGGGGDGGSAESRQALLIRSIFVSLRHPLLGVGMNNFPILSIHDKVSHNAYTQVSSEMGMPALAAYVLFMLAALGRMRRVERATAEDKKRARVHYLAVGMQASLIGYMVASFFASVAYLWYVYYLVGYALCLDRLYAARGAETFARALVSRARGGETFGDAPAGEVSRAGSGAESGRVPAVALDRSLAARGGR